VFPKECKAPKKVGSDDTAKEEIEIMGVKYVKKEMKSKSKIG